MNTLEKIRKPVHNRCFGIEIECLSSRVNLEEKFFGFFYCGKDGSIRTDWRSDQSGYEFVSQPLPYLMLQKQISLLEKRVGKWTTNNSCGIHVHVSKTAVSMAQIKRLWLAVCELTTYQATDLFGRPPNVYCHTKYVAFSRDRNCAINTRPTPTYEFRMFSSGDAKWAQECLRRTKIMCGMRGTISYDTLLEAFSNPENK